MNSLPKISIIIPVYNVEEYITECLQSVMRQTYKGEIECIVVDDCGTDNSIVVAEQLIAEYKGSISFRILHHDHNRGLSAARNTGTDAATGDYIYYLDSDDYISNDCMVVLTQPLEDKKYDMVIGDYITFGDKREIGYLFDKRTEIIGNSNIADAFAERQIYVMAWNKLCKLSFLKENNITFKECQLHEDELWTYKLLQSLRYVYIAHRKIYFYRIRKDSIVNDVSKLNRKLEGYYHTLLFIQTHRYQNKNTYDKILLYYWTLYLSIALCNHIEFKQQYVVLQRSFPYSLYKSFWNRTLSISQVKRFIYIAMPPSLGYWYVHFRYYKNNRLIAHE